MSSTLDLFDPLPQREILAEGAVILRGRVLEYVPVILSDLAKVVEQAGFRQMMTPGGLTMSAAMTNCGSLGWVTDRRGYRYAPRDPVTDRPWPPMPPFWMGLAAQLAEEAGYTNFVADACLINRYEPGAKMSLHQDKDEADLSAPIVSLSLGLSAIFLWGGLNRADRAMKLPLHHGDAVVWGGPSRLIFHGIAPIKPGVHPVLGAERLNLTFRRAAGVRPQPLAGF